MKMITQRNIALVGSGTTRSVLSSKLTNPSLTSTVSGAVNAKTGASITCTFNGVVT